MSIDNDRGAAAGAVPRVLIIDDDEDCRLIYSIALEAEGFEVETANDGAAGVRLALAKKPDVILLDISMPVMDGRQAVRALKTDQNTRHIPTLAITAVASLHTRGELEAAGFDAVLLKPVLPGIVVTAVRQALSVR